MDASKVIGSYFFPWGHSVLVTLVSAMFPDLNSVRVTGHWCTVLFSRTGARGM